MARPRTVTSGTWQGLGVNARADLHASESAPRLREALRAVLGTSVDLSADADRYLTTLIHSAVRESFLAGAQREADLTTAYAAEKQLRLKLQRVLIDAGIPVPRLTD